MTALLILATAHAADIHLKLSSPDGVTSAEESWPALETLSKKYGPFTVKKVPTVWSVTAQPSVFDALEGKYLVSITACVRWQAKGKADERCEKYDLAVGPSETVLAERELKGKGVKLAWSLSAWYTGETPPIGLPAPEPRPIPGQ
jgi:hypothetical protein